MIKKLAIIDWGIGGISIYKLLKEELGLAVLYFSDTGATPYGKMTRSELAARLNIVVTFLKDRGVTHLVIGCNAASTAIPYLNKSDLQIEGVIDAAVAESVRQRPTSLGVIGGRRTIVSGVYRRAFANCGLEARQRIAQPLSGLIENGDVSSHVLQEAARNILKPIRNCSHVLLACTHYPAITSVLANFVSPSTRFIDPARAVIGRISTWNVGSGGGDLFLTTGHAAAMRRSAKLAFGVKLEEISTVRI